MENYFLKKKEATSSITTIIAMLISLTVVGMVIIAVTEYTYDMELKKSIERVADSYVYIMESNGGLSESLQTELENELKAIQRTDSSGRNLGITSVSLSGSACYGKAGQSSTPVTYNDTMELVITADCSIYSWDVSGLTVRKGVSSVSTRVKRKTISHGIY